MSAPGWRGGGGTNEEKVPPKPRVKTMREIIYFTFKEHEILFLKPALCSAFWMSPSRKCSEERRGEEGRTRNAPKRLLSK